MRASSLVEIPETIPRGAIYKVIYVSAVDLTIRIFFVSQLRSLAQQGFSVGAVCSDGPWIADIEQAGIPVKKIRLTRKISPLQDLRALGELWWYFFKVKPTIVHTHTPKPNLLGRLAARLAGVPIVIGTEHGFYFSGKTGATYWFHLGAVRLGAWLSDAVFVINKDDFELARREKIVSPSKLIYLSGGMGVDLNRFDPKTVDGFAVRAELGIKPTNLVVGMVARLSFEKGLREFLDAAVQVAAAFPESLFLVVGPADEVTPEHLEALTVNLGIRSKVQFLGMRTDMPELYSAMDVVVLPSHREGLGLTLVEAGAMGKPVVATNIVGCNEAVSDGETGLLVPPRNAQALAGAVIQLLQDEGKRRTMGEAGRRHSEAFFDQRRVFQQVESTYRRLLSIGIK